MWLWLWLCSCGVVSSRHVSVCVYYIYFVCVCDLVSYSLSLSLSIDCARLFAACSFTLLVACLLASVARSYSPLVSSGLLWSGLATFASLLCSPCAALLNLLVRSFVRSSLSVASRHRFHTSVGPKKLTRRSRVRMVGLIDK